MNIQIRIGILGYGNLGRGVELAIGKNPDTRLVGIYSRRPPSSIQPISAQTLVEPISVLPERTKDIDVLILCGGSKDDLPEQGPSMAALFNTVDSFDTHARIPEYFALVDTQARANQKTALISIGWDPGLFSLNRLFGEVMVPDGETYTFWGKGLSQGHSDAIRRVPGVKAGVQYTIPSDEAMAQVRGGSRPELGTRDKHRRECFVVLEENANAQAVREAIVGMPNYFADYDTSVHFIDMEELAAKHSAMPHGGFVIRSGSTSETHKQVIEYGLTLDSNPEFTASVLVAYARAAWRLSQSGQYGAKSVFDIAPGLLSPKTPEQLRAELL